MSEYRYMSKDGVIYRGRTRRIEDPDLWSYYAENLVGFYDQGWRGLRIIENSEYEDDSRRALDAWKWADVFGQDRDEALDRVAKRIAGDGGSPHSGARFVKVSLDRGMDAYVLYYGIPDELVGVGTCDERGQERHWDTGMCTNFVPDYTDDSGAALRDEVEHVWNNEVYRIEVERWTPGGWEYEDYYGEDYYGEDNATAALVEEFPLSEFPAEMVVE